MPLSKRLLTRMGMRMQNRVDPGMFKQTNILTNLESPGFSTKWREATGMKIELCLSSLRVDEGDGERVVELHSSQALPAQSGRMNGRTDGGREGPHDDKRI